MTEERSGVAAEGGRGGVARSADELSVDERRVAAPAGGARRVRSGRTRGRGEDGLRTNRVKVRFSDAELAAVEAMADRLNMATSSWIGELAVQFARGQLQPIPANERDLVAEWLRHRVDLVRAGTVINQVAKHANSTGEWPEGVEQLVALADRLLTRVDEATARANERARWAR